MEITSFNQIQPQLCVNAKVRRLHRLLNGPHQDLIRPYGLKGSMLSILFMIGKSNINQKKIAQQMVLDESTMSRDLKKLESLGFIDRARGVDARHVTLRITETGHSLLDDVSPKWAALHEKVAIAIGDELLESLNKLMQKLENLEL